MVNVSTKRISFQISTGTYGQLVLSQCRRHVQILGDDDVTKVLTEADTPHGQPIYVVDSQVTRQLDFNVLALVAAQHIGAGQFEGLARQFFL